MICATCSGLVLGSLVTHVFSRQLLSLFVPNNEEALFYGYKKMFYTTGFMWISAYMACVGSALQALGYPTFATLNNLISVLGFRIIWMNFIYVKAPSIDLLYSCYTVSWTITAIVGTAFLIYVYRKYRRQEMLYEQEHMQIQT
jgi:Na+-driven multidrug efflux pump